MTRRLLILGLTGALLGVAIWLGWSWYSTPVPPQVPLEGLARPTAEAIEKATQEVRRAPRSDRTWGKLGLVLYANGFQQQGVACLERASRLDTKELRWIYWQGKAALAGDLQKGSALLGQALGLTDDPEQQSAIHFTLAQALLEAGQFAEAQEHGRALLKMAPEDPRAHWVLGLVALGREDDAEAQEHLRRLTDCPFAQKSACGLLAGLVKDKNKSLAYRQRVAELHPDYEWPDVFEASLAVYREEIGSRVAGYRELEGQGRQQEALAHLRQLVEDSPDEQTCYTLGAVLLPLNQFRDAEQAFRQALTFNDRNAKIHFMLAYARLLRGEQEDDRQLFAQAVADADNAINLQSSQPMAHWVRGRALNHLGRKEEAIAALRQAVLQGPELGELHQSLGEALAEAGQFKEALEYLENAVQHAKPAARDAAREVLEKWTKKAKMSP
jgi:tetratricopeptide (TPR) repeat protein